MIPCDTGRLRAWLDDELDATAAAATAGHVAECPVCRDEQAALERAGTMVRAAFARLDPVGPERSPIEPALARVRATAGTPETNLSRRWWMNLDLLHKPMTRRVAFGALGVATAVLVLFTFAPARQAAAQFLQLFRVKSFTVVPVSEQRMQQLQGLQGALDAGLLGQPTMLREPGEPQPVADVAAAGSLTGFAVREPAYLPAGLARQDLSVSAGPALRLDMSREQLQGILEVAGITDVAVPPVAQLSVSVDVPMAAVQTFGNGMLDDELRQDVAPEAGRRAALGPRMAARQDGAPYLGLVQLRQPTIQMPAGVDPAVLGGSLLQLLGVAPDEALRLARTIDWTSTLVIPVPAGAARFREVSVDGESGVLLGGQGRYAERERAVMWQKDGIVYGLMGQGVTDSELLQVADSLH